MKRKTSLVGLVALALVVCIDAVQDISGDSELAFDPTVFGIQADDNAAILASSQALLSSTEDNNTEEARFKRAPVLPKLAVRGPGRRSSYRPRPYRPLLWQSLAHYRPNHFQNKLGYAPSQGQQYWQAQQAQYPSNIAFYG